MKIDPKPLLASKTLWFNLLTGAVSIAGYLPPPYGPAVIAIGNIILRTWFTAQPIGGVLPGKS